MVDFLLGSTLELVYFTLVHVHAKSLKIVKHVIEESLRLQQNLSYKIGRFLRHVCTVPYKSSVMLGWGTVGRKVHK